VIETPNGGIIHPVALDLSLAASRAVDAAGRNARLERIIQNDYRFVWRLLRRLGVPSDVADDATQQVFLVVAERLKDIREHSERSFAFGTALRVARSAHRLHSRETGGDESDLHESPLPGPEELSDQKRARDVLDRVLDAMTPDLRAVFVLFELEGLKSPEIAELMDVPLGTVASRLRRAREKFHALVEEYKQNLGGDRV
jgi:RNA polymerase sigma-70 factor (ECF subfamily)